MDFHPFLGSFVTLLAVFDLSAREVTSGPPATELKLEVPHPVFPDEVTADGRLSLPVRSMIQRCVDAFNVLPTVAFQKIDMSSSAWDSTSSSVLYALLRRTLAWWIEECARSVAMKLLRSEMLLSVFNL